MLTPTPAPVTPTLLRAFGYSGDARYVGAYWEPGGDELMLADGRISFTANWHAWLAYLNHPAVAPHLFHYNFGASDFQADHWLIIDRAENKAYVAPVREARAFLRAQWGAAPAAAPLPAADLRRLTEMAEVQGYCLPGLGRSGRGGRERWGEGRRRK